MLQDALEKQQARNDEVEKKVRRILELVKAEKVQIYKKVKEQFQSFRAEIKEARKKDREITELKMKLAELEVRHSYCDYHLCVRLTNDGAGTRSR